MNKTGDLRLDTSDLQITIRGDISQKGTVYFEACDQHGNTEIARTPERAEGFLRAKVNVSRNLS